LGESKAIFLAARSEPAGARNKPTRHERREKKRSKLPSHIRILLREKLAEEARTGLLYAKILWGIIWLTGFPVP
jgi:hypothetical protein